MEDRKQYLIARLERPVAFVKRYCYTNFLKKFISNQKDAF